MNPDLELGSLPLTHEATRTCHSNHCVTPVSHLSSIVVVALYTSKKTFGSFKKLVGPAAAREAAARLAKRVPAKLYS